MITKFFGFLNSPLLLLKRQDCSVQSFPPSLSREFSVIVEIMDSAFRHGRTVLAPPCFNCGTLTKLLNPSEAHSFICKIRVFIEPCGACEA